MFSDMDNPGLTAVFAFFLASCAGTVTVEERAMMVRDIEASLAMIEPSLGGGGEQWLDAVRVAVKAATVLDPDFQWDDAYAVITATESAAVNALVASGRSASSAVLLVNATRIALSRLRHATVSL